MNYEQPFDYQHFVEEMGLMFEQDGFPRMAGRIFGWLLVSNPPQQSHSDLAEVLHASKGSISTMTQLLIRISLIERVSLPGDRRDYFQIKPNAWSQLNTQLIQKVTAYRQVAERGLSLLEGADPFLKRRLQEMRDIHAFWERELPILIERWQLEQEASRQRVKDATPKTPSPSRSN